MLRLNCVGWAHGLLRAVIVVLSLLTLVAPAHADTRTFTIDPQDLSGALKDFGIQSHREIFFAPELARGRQSQGVHGKLDELKALDIILHGTGLGFSVTASGAILIRDLVNKVGSTAVPQDGGEADPALEEIMVTATRRSESIQNVPMAITALNQNFLERTGSQQFQDVGQAGPGLAFNPNTAGSAALSIRGVNTSSSTGNTQSPVALYMDE